MKKITHILLLSFALSFCFSTLAFADCKDRVKEVREDIEKDPKKYKLEARLEAQKQLVQAELPSLSLFQCTEHILKAKKALRNGRT